MSSTQERRIEAEIRHSAPAAPRVTLDDVDANIVHTEIVTHVSHSGQVLRWAVLTTRNGFAVTGRPSAAVNAVNDRPEIGVKVAIANARAELWPLMGYALAERQAGPSDAMVNRFLSWPLPGDVSVDPCAMALDFPGRSGTNLLTAQQAEAMLRHVLAG